MRVTAHERGPSRQSELQVALSQCEFCQLALGDVSRQTLYAQQLSGRVKLAPCRLLQPYLTAVWADKAERQSIRRIVGTEFAYVLLEALAIFSMDPSEEIVARRT